MLENRFCLQHTFFSDAGDARDDKLEVPLLALLGGMVDKPCLMVSYLVGFAASFFP